MAGGELLQTCQMIILALVGTQGSAGGGGSKKKKRDAADVDREALLPLTVQCLVALLRLCMTQAQLRRVLACLPVVEDADATPGTHACTGCPMLADGKLLPPATPLTGEFHNWKRGYAQA